MIVRRVSDVKDGQVEVSLVLSAEQASYIMNVGLATLVASGAATIQEMTRAQHEADIAQQEGADVPSPASEESTYENPATRH